MDRRRLLALFNVALAVGLAAFVIWTTEPWRVWQFESTFVAIFAASLVVDAVLVMVWAHRHALVLGATGWRIPAKDLVPLVTFSNTANNLSPAASGEVLRAWFLKRNFGMPLADAGGAITFERLFMFGLMTLTAAIALLVATDGGSSYLLIAALAIAAYVLLTPALLAPLARRMERWDRPAGGRTSRFLKGVAAGAAALWSDQRVALGTTLWSLTAFVCIGSVFWLSSISVGLALDPVETWALVGGGTAVGVLSTLPFGLGAAELTGAGIAAMLGLDVAAVTATFVIYRLFFTLPLALAGSYSWGKLTLQRAPAADER